MKHQIKFGVRINMKNSFIKAKGKYIVCALITVCVMALAIISTDMRLSIKTYKIDAEEITTPIRFALVTDLHSCRYGEGQSELIDAIVELKPDAVLLGGDIFDENLPVDGAEEFLSAITKLYPCYYVTGNHEYYEKTDDPLITTDFDNRMASIQKYGITRLSGESVTLEINGEELILCGVDDRIASLQGRAATKDESVAAMINKNADPERFNRQLEAVASDAAQGGFSILLSHRPEYFPRYCELGFDVVLCGHAHGGQWRIPYLLNGLYAPHQGLFPEYAGGLYENDGTTMIVSRGLARGTTWIPRIFNRPELVLVEIS